MFFSEYRCFTCFLPYPADDKNQEGANRAYLFAQKNDIPYTNFLDTQVCDFQPDLHDEDSYLNALGAKKYLLIWGTIFSRIIR